MKLGQFSDLTIADFNDYLDQVYQNNYSNKNLVYSMRYSLANGGKRIRPLMVLATLKAFQGPVDQGMAAAAALESIHTYSLIHDDLPAMDDDDYRRGQLSNHKAFDEATAILAGDALLTHAFYIISNDDRVDSDTKKLALVSRLSETAGMLGMVGGQINDILGEGLELNLEELQAIHDKKTAALMRFALEAAAIILDLSADIRSELSHFASHFGLAYQIHNDLQEVLWTDEQRGKQAASDESHEKNTYPALLSTQGAKDSLQAEIDTCQASLARIKEYNADFDSDLMAGFLDYLSL
ncbi:polyprenyl synthetase family protein [Aerococcus kribbianus]|uniref:Farnesyl diphosphate synthase n=1 Tax=Aerococcus kribbianus TaxID=2999064 RepID=A0A9X3FUA8_9LACT|nr:MULTISPECIES: farnesyl diphosphate synthase [unclassified Aerococcus]MCZ0717011.1 polyprenyl synthetase family protein [Aerococcus sp. YH-aer221]MCZ0725299.1 polyprenyl synthetase family protein [Aerococcus sp. YH-aer222]